MRTSMRRTPCDRVVVGSVRVMRPMRLSTGAPSSKERVPIFRSATHGDPIAAVRSLRIIAIPRGVTEIGMGAFARCDVTSFSVDAGNQAFAVDGALLLSRDGKQLIGCVMKLAIVVIPSTVGVLGRGCFKGDWRLVAVEFEAGSRLRLIDEDAFMESSLRRMAIPRAVTVMCTTCRAVRPLS